MFLSFDNVGYHYRCGCESDIQAVRAAYAALSDDAKAYVTKLAELEAVEAALQALKDAALLASAKTTAKTNLEGYKNPEDYRDAEKAQLATIVSEGKAAIDAATTVAGVDAALAHAKSLADALKTKAQYEAEESQSQSGDTPATPGQPADSTPSEDNTSKKKCGGSIIVSSALVSTLALAGLGLLVSKKRKQD